MKSVLEKMIESPFATVMIISVLASGIASIIKASKKPNRN